METVIDYILQGESTKDTISFDVINRRCVENIEKSLSLSEFEVKIKECENPLKRIQLVRKYFQWIPVSRDNFQNTKKSKIISKILNEKGEAKFQRNNLQDALRCYSLSIMFAPEDEEALGQIFANRSAVLLSIGRKKESLEDLEFALKTGCSESLKQELETRIENYERRVGEGGNGNSCSVLAAEKEREKRRKFCDGILFRVKQPNADCSVLEEFVREDRNEERGRMLVVTRDIPAGTVLLVEKPYACVLSKELKWETAHCHQCFKKLVNGIPCSSCSFKIYCSASCRDTAKLEYHGDECKLLPYLHAASTPRYALLALRIVLKLRIEKISEIWTETETGGATGSIKQEDSTDGALEDYLKVHSLVSHSEKLSAMELYSNTLQALCLVSALDEHTEFFKRGAGKDAGIDKQNEIFELVVATLLLHLEIVPCNAISLDEFQGLEWLSLLDTLTTMRGEEVKQIVKSLEYTPFGAGIYGITSIINHSCDPNATRIIGPREGILAVAATRNLKAGEEICASYSKYFANDLQRERTEYLETNYFFTCNCIACRFNWPVLNDLVKISNVSFCCTNCSKLFRRESKNGKTGFLKCILRVHDKRKLKCDNCGEAYEKIDAEREFEKNCKLFHQACHLVTTNMPLEGIRLLFSVSKYFESRICPPFVKSVMTQNLFKHALQLIVHYS